jgi:hypothetical protein
MLLLQAKIMMNDDVLLGQKFGEWGMGGVDIDDNDL